MQNSPHHKPFFRWLVETLNQVRERLKYHRFKDHTNRQKPQNSYNPSLKRCIPLTCTQYLQTCPVKKWWSSCRILFFLYSPSTSPLTSREILLFYGHTDFEDVSYKQIDDAALNSPLDPTFDGLKRECIVPISSTAIWMLRWRYLNLRWFRLFYLYLDSIFIYFSFGEYIITIWGF